MYGVNTNNNTHMKNLTISILLVASLVYIVSCNQDSNNFSPVSHNIVKSDLAKDCYDYYLDSGGTCTNGNFQCVEIYKNNARRFCCNGYLTIEGTTCTDEPFRCVLPLDETMICDELKKPGPRVPFGDYLYSVCCELGYGELQVNIPNDSIKININLGCDVNYERE